MKRTRTRGLSRRIDAALMAALADAAIAAGADVMRHFGKVSPRLKPDGSPYSEADLDSERRIKATLDILLPDIPVLAEEEVALFGPSAVGDCFVAVDALDGTKEFVAGHSDFTVNIGLIEDGVPIAGVIFAPALQRLWVGSPQAAFTGSVAPGARMSGLGGRRSLAVARPPSGGLLVVASRSHPSAATEDFIARHQVAERISAGSSLKFCLIAEGAAHLYPRFGTTMEWDTAAGHAIVLAAGGVVQARDGGPLRYGKADVGFANDGFIAACDAGLIRDGSA